MNSPLKRVRTALVAAAAAITALGLFAPAAHADYAGPMEFQSTTVVTRLVLTAGRGYLVLQTHLYSTSYVGFSVDIPAGNGTWSGPADVPVPDLGVDCLRQPGPDLAYQCGRGPTDEDDDTLPGMPVGGYQVTIPVTHTGTGTGLTGTAAIDGEHDYGDVSAFQPDTFPVYDAPHVHSTAEVSTAQLSYDSYDTLFQHGDAVVPVSLGAVPGEAVTALDVALPATSWSLTGSNAAKLGLHCHRYPTVVHCVPSEPLVDHPGFPDGRYTLVVDLHFTNPAPQDDPNRAVSTVSLTVGDQPSTVVDTFMWHYPVTYP